jgi:hypothetical protein
MPHTMQAKLRSVSDLTVMASFFRRLCYLVIHLKDTVVALRYMAGIMPKHLHTKQTQLLVIQIKPIVKSVSKLWLSTVWLAFMTADLHRGGSW